MSLYLEDDEVTSVIVPKKSYCGYPDILHGGITATVLDEAMTWAASAPEKKFYFAGEIKVRYRAPIIAGKEVVVKAKQIDNRKKIIFVEGCIVDEKNNVLVRSEGKYYPLPEKDDTMMKNKLTFYKNGFVF